MKKICVNIDDSLYELIKKICSKSGYTISFFLKEAIQKHLGLIEGLLLAKKIIDEEKNS